VCVVKSIQDRSYMNTLHDKKHPSASLPEIRKIIQKRPSKNALNKRDFSYLHGLTKYNRIHTGKNAISLMHSEKPPYRKYYKANCYQILYRCGEQRYVNDSHVYCVILSKVKWQQNERKNNKIMYLMCRPTLSSVGCL